MAIGVIGAGFAASAAWARLADRRRMAALHAWAARRQATELRGGSLPPWVPRELKRDRDLPAFALPVGGRQVAVVPLRSRIRYGYAWALCAAESGSSPLLVLNRVDGAYGRALGARSEMLERVPPDGSELGKHFDVHVARPGSSAPELPAGAAEALLAAREMVVAWIRRSDRVTVLMLRERYRANPSEWLEPGLELLARCV